MAIEYISENEYNSRMKRLNKGGNFSYFSNIRWVLTETVIPVADVIHHRIRAMEEFGQPETYIDTESNIAFRIRRGLGQGKDKTGSRPPEYLLVLEEDMPTFQDREEAVVAQALARR